MEKPVIILGGGLSGTLLACRLKEVLPSVPFRLYTEDSMLGNHQSCSFRESDCRSSMKWLRPLVSHSWKQHHIKFPSYEKWITNPYHLIESNHLHKVASGMIGNSLHLYNKMNLEFALQMGSFVIDTRNKCHFKKCGYRKWLAIEVELLDDHHMIAPVIYDGGIDQKEQGRSLYYLPLSSRKLLIKDFWISDSKKVDLDEMRNALILVLKSKGWRIGKIIREESGLTELPLTAPVIREEGRVINLSGLFHDTTGCQVASIVRLVDRMVTTSFRLGELKDVVKKFRQEEEKDRKFFRYLNRQILENSHNRIFESIYRQPYTVLERFSKGKLTFFDRSRITFGKRASGFAGLARMMIPYSLYPQVNRELTKI